MTLPAPVLTDFPTANDGKEIVVALSKLSASLEVGIPDSADISPLDNVYAILGENVEPADWSSGVVPAGRWSDETDDVERVPNLTVLVPKKQLERYVNKTVTLRFQTSGESGLTNTSAPLSLRIE
ncbi:hypothetical protein [Pseudomonas sp. NPDC089569]|uniref:hypothetical protein n=1 Tax=Pseudomonas sp. NPDC089569 TaxID=3390722 RepID=UPI003CFC27A8